MLRATKIQQYLSAMSRRGISNSQVLENTGLKAADVRADNFVMDLHQSQVLIQNMLDLTGNDALGLELGMEITPSDMGVVGQGMIAAPTLRQAIQLWMSYAPHFYGPVISISISEEENLWRIYVNDEMPRVICYQFCLEEYIALTVSLGEKLMGRPVIYGNLDVEYPAPRHESKYRQLFNCAVNFDSPRNCITVIQPHLDDRIRTRDELLFPIYHHYCDRQSKPRGDEDSYEYKVHSYLLRNLGGNPSCQKMAQEEGCSFTTLRRRLNDEGRHFRKLHNEFRQDIAEEYLKSTTLTAKEIAYFLGYKDTKPFLRAFKQWTGKTVGQYRQEFGRI